MKSIYTSILLIVMVVLPSMAMPAKWDKTQWTNGKQVYSVVQVYKDKVYLSSGGTKEGTAGFLILISPSGKMTYKETEATLAYGKVTWKETKVLRHEDRTKVEHAKFAGREALIIYTITGGVDEVLFRLTGDKNKLVQEDLKAMLVGKYADEAGNSYQIADDGTFTENGNKHSYELRTEANGKYALVFGTDDGNNYRFAFTKAGVNIYKTQWDEEKQLWQQSDSTDVPVLRLRRDPLAGEPQGLWPMATERLLNRTVLLHCPKEVRLNIVDDMYARHKYYFTDAATRAYFEKQGWYKADPERRTVSFSEIEQINLELIQLMNKYPNEGEVHFLPEGYDY